MNRVEKGWVLQKEGPYYDAGLFPGDTLTRRLRDAKVHTNYPAAVTRLLDLYEHGSSSYLALRIVPVEQEYVTERRIKLV